MKPKILIIHKGGKVHTWCEDLQAGFREMGCEASVLALRSHHLDERRFQYRTGKKYFDNLVTVNRVADGIRHLKPELIVMLNHVGLPDEAHEQLRKAAEGAPIIAWLADHISSFPERTTPNLDAIYYFDSATLPLLEWTYAAAPIPLHFLPLAANPVRFTHRAIDWKKRREGMVFVGNNSLSRRTMIRELQALGTKVSPFGPRAEVGIKFWQRWKITPASTAALYGSHQAVLNLLQPPNTIHGLNLRAFEVAACGGLGSYPLTPDLGKSFVAGEEIIAYSNSQHLHQQLEILFSDPVRAMAMIQAGHARFRQDHTYTVRARRFLADWCS